MRSSQTKLAAALFSTEIQVHTRIGCAVDGQPGYHEACFLYLWVWYPFACLGTRRMINRSSGFPWKYAFVMSAALSRRPSETLRDCLSGRGGLAPPALPREGRRVNPPRSSARSCLMPLVELSYLGCSRRSDQVCMFVGKDPTSWVYKGALHV